MYKYRNTSYIYEQYIIYIYIAIIYSDTSICLYRFTSSKVNKIFKLQYIEKCYIV